MSYQFETKGQAQQALESMRQPFRHYPRCSKCPLSKDMSLICLNTECDENYFKLICPYCHRDKHQRHELKVEDDVDLVLQILEDHTRNRLINKQVTDQDMPFIDKLLESQKHLNKLLNKIQQVKFILDDTLNGYKNRMREFEDMIRVINNAQMSSNQSIINEQLMYIKNKIQYNSNQEGVSFDWNFEQSYNVEEKAKREGFSEKCLIAIQNCEKTFKNLVIKANFNSEYNLFYSRQQNILTVKQFLRCCNSNFRQENKAEGLFRFMQQDA